MAAPGAASPLCDGPRGRRGSGRARGTRRRSARWASASLSIPPSTAAAASSARAERSTCATTARCWAFRPVRTAATGLSPSYVVVPRRIVFPLPDSLTFERAAMIEAVSVALHAVKITPVRQGDTAVVVGAGMIGLLAVQALRNAGCGCGGGGGCRCSQAPARPAARRQPRVGPRSHRYRRRRGRTDPGTRRRCGVGMRGRQPARPHGHRLRAQGRLGDAGGQCDRLPWICRCRPSSPGNCGCRVRAPRRENTRR